MKKTILFMLSILFLFWWVFALFFDYIKENWIEIIDEPQVPSVNLIAWWDIMISRGIWWRAKKYGYWWIFSWDNYNPLTQYDCYQSWDCLLVFNLESMFSKNDNDDAYWWFMFRSNTWNLQYLLDLKRNNKLVLSLANNHTNNAWWEGVILTREILSWANIGFMWAWENTGEATQIYQLEKNGIHLCFQAFSYEGTSGRYGWINLARNPLNIDLIKESLTEMEDTGCEVKIINPHRWREYRLHPTQEQRNLAYEIIDAWADIVLWGHSHIPWSYEKYHDKPIFYSFWNFIFDQDWGKKATEGGYDYIYDFELKRRTVPTYIPLLAGMKITKYWTGISISEPEFKMARVNKGLYSEIDAETFTGIMSELAF